MGKMSKKNTRQTLDEKPTANAIHQAELLQGFAFIEEALMLANQLTHSAGLARLAQIGGLSRLEEKQANKLFQAANEGNLEELQKYIEQNMPSARVIALFASIAASVGRDKLKSEQASFRASAPRKKQYKDGSAEMWEAWQKNPDCYENKARFIDDICEKFQISANTAREWFDQFRSETSSVWEVKFGKKYPQK